MRKSNFKVKKLKSFVDERGKLIVFLQTKELDKKHKNFGQIYFVTFSKRDAVRGNHYHKKWHEWFGVVEGKVLVKIEDVRTKKKKQITLSALRDKYVRIETGPYIAHAIKSLSKNATLLSYAESQWDKKDTHYYKLM